MKEKTTYIAKDGQEFESQEECLNHQYSLIDWTLFNKSNNIDKAAKWIDIDKYTYEVTDIKPIGEGDKADYFYNKLFFQHNYLWIPNIIVLEYFHNILSYLSAKDREIAREIRIGLNYIKFREDDGDYSFDWEVKNIQKEMLSLQEDLKEIQDKIAYYRIISDNFSERKSLEESLLGV